MSADDERVRMVIIAACQLECPPLRFFVLGGGRGSGHGGGLGGHISGKSGGFGHMEYGDGLGWVMPYLRNAG